MLTMKFFDGLTYRVYKEPVKLSTVFSKIVKSYHQYKIYITTLRELNKLSDRELDDIGLCRGDIELLARQSAYGEV